MSNKLDPDQDQRFVGPDLGPNWLSRLSADDTGRQRVKSVNQCLVHIISSGIYKQQKIKNGLKNVLMTK